MNLPIVNAYVIHMSKGTSSLSDLNTNEVLYLTLYSYCSSKYI